MFSHFSTLNHKSIFSMFNLNLKRFILPGVGQLGTHLPRTLLLNDHMASKNFEGISLPVVSIVVPSFNQGKFIGATLKSIIDQRYPNLELIVIDGGSTDNTISVIKQYEKYLAWWVTEADSEQAAAINKGFSRTTGEIMAWNNSGDIMAPGVIHHIVSYLAKHPEIQAVYRDRIVINEEVLYTAHWILQWHSSRVLQCADFVPQETLYWTLSAWNQIAARLYEAFRFAMGWDFLLRLPAENLKIQHLPVSLGLFRVHDQQKTSSQMSSIGQHEIRIIRYRELGFQPSRWQLILSTAPFLLSSKFHELRFRLGLTRSICV